MTKRSRCPDCGCFISPWMPVDYCKNCDVSNYLRKIEAEQRKNGYRRVLRHLRTKSRLPFERE